MDVKFVRARRSQLNKIDIVPGQVIALVDSSAWYYDTLENTRLCLSSSDIRESLPVEGTKDVLYCVYGQEERGLYIWKTPQFIKIGEMPKVDSALSLTSENAVMNRIVAAELDKKMEQADLDEAVRLKLNYTNPSGVGYLSLNREDTHIPGQYSSSLGYKSEVTGQYASSRGFHTKADYDYMDVAGRYNETTDNAMRVTGNGTSDRDRKDIEVLDTEGNYRVTGDVQGGDVSLHETKNEVDNLSTELTQYKQSVADTYLSQETARSTYLSKEDAGQTYLGKQAAGATYLSKEDAGQTYLSKQDAKATYLNKEDAATTYMNRQELSNTFLSFDQASDIYLTREDAESTYMKKDIQVDKMIYGILDLHMDTTYAHSEYNRGQTTTYYYVYSQLQDLATRQIIQPDSANTWPSKLTYMLAMPQNAQSEFMLSTDPNEITECVRYNTSNYSALGDMEYNIRTGDIYLDHGDLIRNNTPIHREINIQEGSFNLNMSIDISVLPCWYGEAAILVEARYGGSDSQESKVVSAINDMLTSTTLVMWCKGID